MITFVLIVCILFVAVIIAASLAIDRDYTDPGFILIIIFLLCTISALIKLNQVC